MPAINLLFNCYAVMYMAHGDIASASHQRAGHSHQNLLKHLKHWWRRHDRWWVALATSMCPLIYGNREFQVVWVLKILCLAKRSARRRNLSRTGI